jgi:hypothetical protein
MRRRIHPSFALSLHWASGERVMTAWLPTSSQLKFDDLDLTTSNRALADVGRQWRTARRNVRDILSICSHGLTAAHSYERMKSQSGADLAANGLQRGDVPRAIFRKLTERF